MMLNQIKEQIIKTQAVLQLMADNPNLHEAIKEATSYCISQLRTGHKILFAGNGGSAADAQHLAAELVCRFSYNRQAIPALALTTDTSTLTAISNDFAFESIFSRQIEALGQNGDVLFAISTSGKSPNIIKALEVAKTKQLITIGLTGKSAPLMNELCDVVIHIPTHEVAKIQECHIMVGHIICMLIENIYYSELSQHNSAQLSLSQV